MNRFIHCVASVRPSSGAFMAPHRAVRAHGTRRLGVCLVLAGMTLAGLPAAGGTAEAADAAPAPSASSSTAGGSHTPKPGADNFAPASRTVTPVKVTRTTGSVDDPAAVLD